MIRRTGSQVCWGTLAVLSYAACSGCVVADLSPLSVLLQSRANILLGGN